MRKYYILITGFMLMPLLVTGIAWFIARDVIMPDIDVHLLCGGAVLLLGAVCMLGARRALKKGTYIGRASNRVRVSGKKGEKYVLLGGAISTVFFAAVFSLLILADIF